jgi:hypothetical protein
MQRLKFHKLFIFVSICIGFGCNTPEDDFSNSYKKNTSVYRQIAELDLTGYEYVEYSRGNFHFVVIDSLKQTLKPENIKILIAEYLNEIDSDYFDYRRNAYRSVRADDRLLGLFYITAGIDESVELDEITDSLQNLLNRYTKKISPYAKKIDTNWYWIEINATI